MARSRGARDDVETQGVDDQADGVRLMRGRGGAKVMGGAGA